ncbi:chemotaxis protein MotB [Scopulibacillus daqui]|uniref:Chemotaxis protein MotB n=1 Tax=Scopulibacillus daqui TaxID=1469162 RepID=A0ABS2Q3W3_9BACL|nr:OmpA family protein [Scopulibacillus daqui]MBM7646993.1 chemotaxis protein MotB [Scopulibacillus daqui]
MKKRRQKKNEQGENHERWMITYSDLITVLLVFIVVLYSMSQVQNQKFNALINSLHTAFKGDAALDEATKSAQRSSFMMPEETVKKDNKYKKKEEENNQRLNKLYVKLDQFIKKNGLNSDITLKNLPKGVRITFKDNILFDLGSASLKEQAKPVLHKVGQILKNVPNDISIEGHTDNTPIGSRSRFRSNWELSGARAQSVIEYLVQHDGLEKSRMQFVGYGEYKPIVKNDTPEHKAMNRRVNIVVLRHDDVP